MCGEYGSGIYIYYGDDNGNISGGGKISDADGNSVFGIGRFTGPAIADLDGDGLKDLIVACSIDSIFINGWDTPGPLKFYKNIGTEGAPSYQFQETIKDKNGEEIKWVYLRVQIADMNNDGLLDIVTANTVDKNSDDTASNIYYYQNIGSITDPLFDVGIKLTLKDGSDIHADYAIRIGITDIDNDGVKDILLNTSHHYPGKAGVLLGELGTTNGKLKYSIKSSTIKLIINGSILTFDGMTAVKLFNVAGEKIGEKINCNTFNHFDLKRFHVAPGLNIVEITSGDRIIKTKYIRRRHD